ncbi:hypothetical protein ACFLWS_03100 [Chloroflexota bacterium]
MPKGTLQGQLNLHVVELGDARVKVLESLNLRLSAVMWRTH